MKEQYLIGVDIGTYESKGVLTTTEGRVISIQVRPHQLSFPRPGWVEHDAEKIWWVDFCSIVQELFKESGVRPTEVIGVGCSAIGPDMLPVDENGRPLRPAVLYGIDTRATREIDDLEKRFGREEIFAHCGNYLSSQSVGPKILWLKNNEPDVYRKAYKIVTGTSFLVARLTGNYVIDHYTAAAGFTPLYDNSTGDWSRELGPAIVEPHKLPRLAWTGDLAGTVTGEAAAQTGLTEGTPVITGTCDAAAEAVSVGVVDPGQLMLMYGSTVFLIEVIDRPLKDKRLWSAPYLFPGTYCFAAGMATSGAITRWFRDNFACDLFALEKANGENAYAALAREAAKVAPGANGLIVLPYFSGERTPINDPLAKGVIFGLTLTHSRGDVFRAILEGVGHGIKHHLDVLQQIGVSPDTLVAVGGGTKNRVWLEIVSDICNLPQQIPAVTIGASYGDAFLAGLGTGVFSSYRAIKDWVQTEEEVKPHLEPDATYRQYHGLYLRLYRQSKDLMQQIHFLR